MPTVLTLGRYRFFFYSNERGEPAHIHVGSGGSEARFWLGSCEVARTKGFAEHEVRELAHLVYGHRETLLEKWTEYFDRS